MFHHAVITGASSGLGAAVALELAGQGGRLELAGRDIGRLEEVATACRAKGALVHTTVVDVTDRAAMQGWLGEVSQRGVPDLVVANAGISGGTAGRGEEPVEQALAIWHTNLLGVLHSVEPLLPAMKAAGRGHVVLVGSLAGFRGLPSAPAYSASKMAVRAYGEALAPLLRAHGVKVSVVCPGFIRTPMTECNSFTMPGLMDAEAAARRMLAGVTKGEPLIAFPFAMALMAKMLGHLPRRVSDWLVAKLPAKG